MRRVSRPTPKYFAAVGVCGLLGLPAVARPAPGASYEGPRTFRASEILKPAEIRGAHFSVVPEVRTEGFFHLFRLQTSYGPLEVEGRSALLERQRETNALARLDEVSKTRVFLEAAGNSVVNVGRGVAAVVVDPKGTAKGIGGGLKRFGTNLGRKVGRAKDKAVDRIQGDDDAAAGEGQSTGGKVASAGRGIAHSILGVNGAARRWAKKVGVDPYTTNPLLKKALIDIGRVDAAGSIATAIALPIPALLGHTARVGHLVWDSDPEELLKSNEAKLREVGAAPEVIRQLYLSPGFTLTLQTRLAEALHEVKVSGCGEYAAVAAEADSEREALFFVESAEMLARLSRETPLAAVLGDSRAMVAGTRDARAVILLPVDWIRWTRAFEEQLSDVQSRTARELGARTLVLQTTARLSRIARRELAKRGISVVEGLPPALEEAK